MQLKHNFKVCGLDEAGRGALAGSLVIAAVVMSRNFNFSEVAPRVTVRDSKELSKQQREALFRIIEKYSLQIEVEVISVQEINDHGINWANTEGFRRLIMKIDADQYIVDGRWHLPSLATKTSLTSCVVGGDRRIPAVLSAGIVAKIKRDEIIQKLHFFYPMYGWDTNTGHGTKRHIEAIRKYGLCEHHRKQFVATALGGGRHSHGRNTKKSG